MIYINKIKLICFSDPQHAWVRVRRSDINALGIAKEITPYSYQKGNFVYLEEDQDWSTYLKALAKANNVDLNIVDLSAVRRLYCDLKSRWTNNSSRIRNFEAYQYDPQKDFNF